MRKRIAFIGGVHGVGKTVFCSKLSKKIEFEHVTASSLIRRQHSINIDKTVNGIDSNQLTLVEELSNYRTAKPIILLDGHFCLLDSLSNVHNVSVDIFKAISPYTLVILKNNPPDIATRLSKRDNRKHSSKQITIMQNRELKWAKSVSASLNIPIRIVDLSLNYEKSISDISLFLQSGGINAHST